jgi:hypothetical protein
MDKEKPSSAVDDYTDIAKRLKALEAKTPPPPESFKPLAPPTSIAPAQPSSILKRRGT